MRLKYLCKRSGKMQKDIARDLGISASTLSQYVTETHAPTPEILTRFADYFGVTVDYILEHDGAGLSLAPNGYDKLTEDDKNAVDYLILRLAGGVA